MLKIQQSLKIRKFKGFWCKHMEHIKYMEYIKSITSLFEFTKFIKTWPGPK